MKAEIIERVRPTFGHDRIEIVTDKDCEIVTEEGRCFVQRRKNDYPKTLEECLQVLNLETSHLDSMYGHKNMLLMAFQSLLICRDAYWKLAGGWKFNYDARVYYIFTENDEVETMQGVCDANAILAFPTDEMRDVFFENFRELIESCKELL